jgi:hypothetical protein
MGTVRFSQETGLFFLVLLEMLSSKSEVNILFLNLIDNSHKQVKWLNSISHHGERPTLELLERHIPLSAVVAPDIGDPWRVHAPRFLRTPRARSEDYSYSFGKAEITHDHPTMVHGLLGNRNCKA